jgi:hypothetical protein
MRVAVKYIVFTIVIALEMAVVSYVSNKYGISTEDTWLGFVGAGVVFLTIDVLLFYNARSIKVDYPPRFWIVRFLFAAESAKKGLYRYAFLLLFIIVAVSTVFMIEMIRGAPLEGLSWTGRIVVPGFN